MQNNRREIEKMAQQGVASILHFAKFANQFSKWVSLVFVLLYCISWVQVWAAYWIGWDDPKGAMECILQPTLVVLAFYFGTKAIENVSKGLCGWLMKRLEVPMKPVDMNDSESYDYGYNDYPTVDAEESGTEIEEMREDARLSETRAVAVSGKKLS